MIKIDGWCNTEKSLISKVNPAFHFRSSNKIDRYIYIEWFIAIITSLPKSAQKSANHFEWHPSTHCRSKIEYSNGFASTANARYVMNLSPSRTADKFFELFNIVGFGLPPTPPSSLSSDDSEDNQSAEISYTSTQSLSQTEPTANSSKTSPNCSSTSRIYNGSSSRQPIHTPLISNQPVCSTSLSLHRLFGISLI